MSTLATSTVTTENSTTPLRLTTGNPSSGSITVNSSNTVISVRGSIVANTGTITDSKGDVREIPVNNQTVAYTLALTDIGKVVATTGNITIPANRFAAGDPITVFNNTLLNRTLTPATGVTLYFAGSDIEGVRTLTARGLCTILCVAPNTFVVTGVGLI